MEYRDIFSILESGRILPKSLAEKCRQMVGLRNRLVHEYTEIDHKIIHKSLGKDLMDFEAYVQAIVTFAKSVGVKS